MEKQTDGDGNGQYEASVFLHVTNSICQIVFVGKDKGKKGVLQVPIYENPLCLRVFTWPVELADNTKVDMGKIGIYIQVYNPQYNYQNFLSL